MITLKQMQYAVAVKNTNNFNKAADICHVSQPTLSAGIADLERRLGHQIFERDNKKVLVTAFGEQFLLKAKKILELATEVKDMAFDTSTPLGRPLSLGIIPTIAPFFLGKFLSAIKQQYPKLKLSITEQQTAVLLKQVKDGSLDAAIIATPHQDKLLESLLTLHIYKEDFYVLSQAQQKISLATDELLLLGDGHCLTDQTLELCKFKSTNNLHTDLSTLNTAIQLVACGLGITIIPQMSLEHVRKNYPTLKITPMSEVINKKAQRTISLVFRPNYTRIKDLEILKNLIQTF